MRTKASGKGEPVVSVSTRGGPFEGVSPAGVRRRAEKMVARLGMKGVELSIGLVDDAAIHELNRSFRHKDKPTDVLAFPMLDALPKAPRPKRKAGEKRAGGGALELPELGGVSGLLGDVIISIETARRQARENSRPLVGEVTMLLAHGLLHLLGYDHQTDAEEREMTEATRELERAAAARSKAGARTRTQTQTKQAKKEGPRVGRARL